MEKELICALKIEPDLQEAVGFYKVSTSDNRIKRFAIGKEFKIYNNGSNLNPRPFINISKSSPSILFSNIITVMNGTVKVLDNDFLPVIMESKYGLYVCVDNDDENYFTYIDIKMLKAVPQKTVKKIINYSYKFNPGDKVKVKSASDRNNSKLAVLKFNSDSKVTLSSCIILNADEVTGFSNWYCEIIDSVDRPFTTLYNGDRYYHIFSNDGCRLNFYVIENMLELEEQSKKKVMTDSVGNTNDTIDHNHRFNIGDEVIVLDKEIGINHDASVLTFMGNDNLSDPKKLPHPRIKEKVIGLSNKRRVIVQNNKRQPFSIIYKGRIYYNVTDASYSSTILYVDTIMLAPTEGVNPVCKDYVDSSDKYNEGDQILIKEKNDYYNTQIALLYFEKSSNLYDGDIPYLVSSTDKIIALGGSSKVVLKSNTKHPYKIVYRGITYYKIVDNSHDNSRVIYLSEFMIESDKPTSKDLGLREHIKFENSINNTLSSAKTCGTEIHVISVEEQKTPEEVKLDKINLHLI